MEPNKVLAQAIGFLALAEGLFIYVQGGPGHLRPEQDGQDHDLIIDRNVAGPVLCQGVGRHGGDHDIDHGAGQGQGQTVEQGSLKGDPGLLGDLDQVREVAEGGAPDEKLRRVGQDLVQGLEGRHHHVDQGQQHKGAHDDAEHQSSVSGQLKFRFLGNHDTVTWTFDAARAQTIYGTERAKAMWMMLGWIDGVLYIYQGDEDPAAYHLEGENLENFFTELIAAKRDYLPNTLDTEYLDTDSAVFACRRFDDSTSRLVLVNLSDRETTYTLEQDAELLTSIGGCTLSSDAATLPPYSGAILNGK